MKPDYEEMIKSIKYFNDLDFIHLCNSSNGEWVTKCCKPTSADVYNLYRSAEFFPDSKTQKLSEIDNIIFRLGFAGRIQVYSSNVMLFEKEDLKPPTIDYNGSFQPECDCGAKHTKNQNLHAHWCGGKKG